MFERLFTKRVDKNKLTEIVEKASEKYYVNVIFKMSGAVEIFIGGKREEEKEESE